MGQTKRANTLGLAPNKHIAFRHDDAKKVRNLKSRSMFNYWSSFGCQKGTMVKSLDALARQPPLRVYANGRLREFVMKSNSTPWFGWI